MDPVLADTGIGPKRSLHEAETCGENSLMRRLELHANTRSFDCVIASHREAV